MTGTFCCVYGCSSRPIHGVSFHRFPKKGQHRVEIEGKSGVKSWVDRRKAWELRLRMGKNASDYMNVCGRHFSKSCFILPDYPAKRRVLKKCAVPDQNLPVRIKSKSATHLCQKIQVKNHSACSREQEKEEVCIKIDDDSELDGACESEIDNASNVDSESDDDILDCVKVEPALSKTIRSAQQRSS